MKLEVIFIKRLFCLSLCALMIFFCGCKKKEENPDITESLVDLGINNELQLSNASYENIYARNPYDMISDGNTVFVSGGNYCDNKGPVIINGYNKKSEKPVSGFVSSTEQITEFYNFSGYKFALCADPIVNDIGDIYYCKEGTEKWETLSAALLPFVHCYDMVEYDGKLFFGGSIRNFHIPVGDGKTAEGSRAAIYSLDKKFSKDLEYTDFEDLKIIKKDGTAMQYGTINNIGVPRVYQLFLFKDKLYAYINCLTYSEKSQNGIYLYDKKKNQFVFQNDLNYEFIDNIFKLSLQDSEKIQHDFEYGDKFYFIANGLYFTKNFKEYKKEIITGFNGYTVRDVIFKNKDAFVLLSRKNPDDNYKNQVLKTRDFESFEPIFCFVSKTFAKSFEYTDRHFFFALGYDERDITVYLNSNSAVYVNEQITPEHKEVGRIYRYKYK